MPAAKPAPPEDAKATNRAAGSSATPNEITLPAPLLMGRSATSPTAGPASERASPGCIESESEVASLLSQPAPATPQKLPAMNTMRPAAGSSEQLPLALAKFQAAQPEEFAHVCRQAA